MHRRVKLLVALAVASAGCMQPDRAARLSRSSAAVRPGITVLLEDSIALIRGKRVALLTNQTGIDAAGRSDIELLRDSARESGRRHARDALLAGAWHSRHRRPGAI